MKKIMALTTKRMCIGRMFDRRCPFLVDKGSWCNNEVVNEDGGNAPLRRSEHNSYRSKECLKAYPGVIVMAVEGK